MTLDDLLPEVKAEEGWRDRPYRDSLDFLTIGYGFLIDERKSVSMPREVGELWMKLILADKWSELTARAPWVMDQPEAVQKALVLMSYQLGVTGVLNFRKMVAALRTGHRVQAAIEALDSTWAKQTKQRAERVATMIRGL
jgi:lysozyme